MVVVSMFHDSRINRQQNIHKVFKMKIVKNFSSVSAEDMKTPPLDTSCYTMSYDSSFYD
jgi:hypothetical protein